MLAAAEAAMDAAAKDDKERAKNHAKLYAPPKEIAKKTRDKRAPLPGAGMSRGQAQALAAQLAAEDAQLTRGR